MNWPFYLLIVLLILFVAPIAIVGVVVFIWWYLDNTVGRLMDWYDKR